MSEKNKINIPTKDKVPADRNVKITNNSTDKIHGISGFM